MKKIETYLGPVSGTDIYLVGGVIGGGLFSQEDLFTSAFEAAKHRMRRNAERRGANAIVGMNTHVLSPGNLNNIIVVVTGTAVIVEETCDEKTDSI